MMVFYLRRPLRLAAMALPIVSSHREEINLGTVYVYAIDAQCERKLKTRERDVEDIM